MSSNYIYKIKSCQLLEKIKSRGLIPYSVLPRQKYEENEWYFSTYYDQLFKVISVEYKNNKLDHAYIKSDEGYYSWIVTELSDWDVQIKRDYKNIAKGPIINTNLSYTGAEIMYWFFVNEISEFNKKYRGFWKYVDISSKGRLDEKTRYFIRGEINGKGIYTNCVISIDYSKKNYSIIRNRINIEKHKNEDNEFMKSLKKHDMRRIRELKEKEILSNENNPQG